MPLAADSAPGGRHRRQALAAVLGVVVVVVVALVFSSTMHKEPPGVTSPSNPSTQVLWSALTSEVLPAEDAELPDLGNPVVTFRDASLGKGVVAPPSIEDT